MEEKKQWTKLSKDKIKDKEKGKDLGEVLEVVGSEEVDLEDFHSKIYLKVLLEVNNSKEVEEVEDKGVDNNTILLEVMDLEKVLAKAINKIIKDDLKDKKKLILMSVKTLFVYNKVLCQM